jgi:hypothetical protein
MMMKLRRLSRRVSTGHLYNLLAGQPGLQDCLCGVDGVTCSRLRPVKRLVYQPPTISH